MIIRPAVAADAAEMTSILNAIIAVGGTTAHQTQFDEAKMQSDYIASSGLVSCYVAKIAGRVCGFQWLGWPDKNEDNMPQGWAVIASFVANEAAGKGVGQRLFKATRKAAIDAGVTTIDATIRADNAPGQRYYGGLGFNEYDRLVDVPLCDGLRVGFIKRRFDLI